MAGGGLALAGQHLGQGRLAGAVAADQTDPVTGRHTERRSREQEPRPDAQLKSGRGDHALGNSKVRRFSKLTLPAPSPVPGLAA